MYPWGEGEIWPAERTRLAGGRRAGVSASCGPRNSANPGIRAAAKIGA